MFVELGNNSAVEGYYGPDDPDRVLFREVEGERVTRIVFPEGIGLPEAYATAIATASQHLARDTVPAWVTSDSKPLADLLAEHYGITAERPADWGQGESKPNKKPARKQVAKTPRKRAAKAEG